MRIFFKEFTSTKKLKAYLISKLLLVYLKNYKKSYF